MMMATKISFLPIYRGNVVLPSLYCLNSSFLSAACCCKCSFGFKNSKHPCQCLFNVRLPPLVYNSKRMVMPAKSSADNNGLGSQPDASPDGGGTRLVRAIQDFLIKLNYRIKEMKKGFPMKVLFFLVGFYCATAFATVIGQTGDWDILSAGLAVVVVEGIGFLMYRASFSFLDRVRNLITMFNYWKAGLSLGLFLDAFKYEDNIFEFCKPFNLEIDIFAIFL